MSLKLFNSFISNAYKYSDLMHGSYSVVRSTSGNEPWNFRNSLYTICTSLPLRETFADKTIIPATQRMGKILLLKILWSMVQTIDLRRPVASTTVPLVRNLLTFHWKRSLKLSLSTYLDTKTLFWRRIISNTNMQLINWYRHFVLVVIVVDDYSFE